MRTVFNILGPMSNPARPQRQLMGVYAENLVAPVARALGELGSRRAIVVCSRDGLDELSLGAPTLIGDFHDGRLKLGEVRPWELGLKRAASSALAGGDARRNAELLMGVLEGKKGPRRDVSLLNAAAALLAAGLARDLKDGLALAARSIDTGRAKAALNALRLATHE